MKADANFETIKTDFLNLEQKISSFTFSWWIKSMSCSVEDLSTNIEPFMRDSNKNLFILNQIYSQKLKIY